MPRSTLAAATSTPSSVRKNPMGEDWSLVRMLEGLLPTSLTKATAAQDKRKATDDVAEAADEEATVGGNGNRVSEETKRQAKEASERWKRSRSVPVSTRPRSKSTASPSKSPLAAAASSSAAMPTSESTDPDSDGWVPLSTINGNRNNNNNGNGLGFGMPVRRAVSNAEAYAQKAQARRLHSMSTQRVSPTPIVAAAMDQTTITITKESPAGTWQTRRGFTRQEATHDDHENITRDKQQQQIQVGRSNANFRMVASWASSSSASSSCIRGPFVRCPTGETVSPSAPSSGTSAAVSPVAACEKQDSGAESSSSSLEGHMTANTTTNPQVNTNNKDDGLRPSPLTSPVHPAPGSRLSPFASPCPSPFLRRRRTEKRASSTGSAVGSSYGSGSGRSNYSTAGGFLYGTSAAAAAAGGTSLPSPSPNHLLSPYSVSPSPSYPTTPTTPSPSPHQSLFSRRLSSCRPSISSCSSSLFSFSSSKEASPDVIPFVLSPRSPRLLPEPAPNPVRSASVFVYPTSPASRANRHKGLIAMAHAAQELGTLNPDLYRDSVDAGVDGGEPTVRFGLRFHDAKEWLEIRIVRIRGLPQHLDEISIKMTLLPDERRSVSAHFSMMDRGCTTELEVNKTFCFPAVKTDLCNRMLKISVSEVTSSGKTITIGEVLKPFKGLAFEPAEEQLFTENCLACDSCEPESARLRVSLCYNATLERLTVAVYECEGIEQLEPQSSKCYVKVVVHHNLKACKTKRTDVVRRRSSSDSAHHDANDPSSSSGPTAPADTIAFDQSFNFKADPEAIKEMGVTLMLMEVTNILDRDRVVGHVVLGGPMLAKGSGEEHWRRATACFQKENILMWHNLVRDNV